MQPKDDDFPTIFGCLEKYGKPPNHPLKNRVFHEINHPFCFFFPPIFGLTPK